MKKLLFSLQEWVTFLIRCWFLLIVCTLLSIGFHIGFKWEPLKAVLLAPWENLRTLSLQVGPPYVLTVTPQSLLALMIAFTVVILGCFCYLGYKAHTGKGSGGVPAGGGSAGKK